MIPLCLKTMYISFFILFDIHSERGNTSRGSGVGEGEAGFLLSREPDAGLIPGPWDRNLSQRQTTEQPRHPLPYS